jgi:hypothetical protein
MKPSTVALVVSQFVVATVFELSWLSDDSGLIDSPFLREPGSTVLLCAQGLAFAAGVWEGFVGPVGSRRLFAYAAASVALMVWFILRGFYLSAVPEPWDVLVLLPVVMGTSVLFAPSWIAVAAGVFLRQRASSTTIGSMEG